MEDKRGRKDTREEAAESQKSATPRPEYATAVSLVCTHGERREVVVHVQDLRDAVPHGADDAVDHVHHTVGRHLVTVDDPGAVHRDHLHGECHYNLAQTCVKLRLFPSTVLQNLCDLLTTVGPVPQETPGL